MTASFLIEKGVEFDKNLIEIVNPFSTMKMLEKGRIAVIPSNSQVIEFYCQTTGCSTTDFKTIYTLKELSEDLYLAVRLGTDEDLVKQLKEGVTQLNLPNLTQ